MINDAIYSSAKHDWCTPQDLLNKIETIFGKFDLDAAATSDNAKCQFYYTEKNSGLHNPWHRRTWCNPPYGREIPKWIGKAFFETHDATIRHCETAVLLLPSRTDTQWFQAAAAKCDFIAFLKGRVKFDGAHSSAPFPSALFVFSKGGATIHDDRLLREIATVARFWR